MCMLVCVSSSRHMHKHPYASMCGRGRKSHTVKAREKGKRRVCMAPCALLVSRRRQRSGRKGVPSAWQDQNTDVPKRDVTAKAKSAINTQIHSLTTRSHAQPPHRRPQTAKNPQAKQNELKKKKGEQRGRRTETSDDDTRQGTPFW